MSGTMSRADLTEDLKGLLMDAALKFTDNDGDDFARHLAVAAYDLGRVRPRTLYGELTLVADQADYAAPADLRQPKFSTWGLKEKRIRRPWNADWPGRLPRLSLVEISQTRELWLDPAPTGAQITAFGATYGYFYFAAHAIADDPAATTVPAVDRPLLLVRAAAQALAELANNNMTKPVQLGGAGVGSMPKNGTPAALSRDLMELFERMAA